MLFFQFSVCAAAVWERGDVTAVSLLAQQFIDEGFVNAEQFGDLPFWLIIALYGINDSRTKIQRVGHRVIQPYFVYSFKGKPL
jgi:hypothetical protein